MKLAFMTAFWRRPEISAIWWAGADRLRETFGREGIDLVVIAGLSPDDPDRAANGLLAHARDNVLGVETPNRPLAAKMNAISGAARQLDPDFLMLMDSDDLLDDVLARAYARMMKEGVQHMGLKDFYFYDAGKLLYWPGYAPTHASFGRSIGCGRIYNRAVAKLAGWQLWEPSDRERGMDALADRRLQKLGIARPAVLMGELGEGGGFAVDIKSAANIWSLDKLEGLPGAKLVALDQVRALPEWPLVEALTPAPLSQPAASP